MTTRVSQLALDAATGELLEFAAPLDEARLDTLASDLAAVATLLAGQPHLRRLLTETTASGPARASLLTRVVGEKVAASSLQLLTATVVHDWSNGSDLARALRHMSHTAVFLGAERASELDDVEDELFRFGRILDASPELSLILDDPATPGDGRAALVERLLSGKAHRQTVTLLTDLARHRSGRVFGHGVNELVLQAAQRRDKVVATVTSAAGLTSDEVDRLRGALQRIYARDVVIHAITDAGLMGGLSIRVDDEVIDGSVVGRLDSIRARLAG